MEAQVVRGKWGRCGLRGARLRVQRPLHVLLNHHENARNHRLERLARCHRDLTWRRR